MDKNILIIGASGLVGEALCAVFGHKGHTVLGADKDPLSDKVVALDICDAAAVTRVMDSFSPDVVCLTAALSYVDYCEQHPEESERINIQGLKHVLDEVVRRKSALVFFSSDYIFDGTAGPYKETDTPNPLCVYGRHKWQAEQMIQEALDHFMIVRTTWVYGPERRGKNFVLSLRRRIEQGETVRVPCDQMGSPTYSLNLAEVLEALIAQDQTGVFNIVGPALLDRFSFAKEICQDFDLSADQLQAVTTQELGQVADRPLKAGLVIDKVAQAVDIPLMDHHTGLACLRMKDVVEGDDQ